MFVLTFTANPADTVLLDFLRPKCKNNFNTLLQMRLQYNEPFKVNSSYISPEKRFLFTWSIESTHVINLNNEKALNTWRGILIWKLTPIKLTPKRNFLYLEIKAIVVNETLKSLRNKIKVMPKPERQISIYMINDRAVGTTSQPWPYNVPTPTLMSHPRHY